MTSDVKDELLRVKPSGTSTALAEMSAMFRMAGGLSIANRELALVAEFTHLGAAERLCAMLGRLFGVSPDLLEVTSELRNGRRYRLIVNESAENVARRLGLVDSRGHAVVGLSHGVMSGTKADAAASWRGAFLARGSLMEPGRNAALEIICPTSEAAYALGGLARRLDIAYRVREARSAMRVDIRGADAISDMLARMGAHDTVITWDELRVEREVTGSVNRLANFDDANMRRSVDAAVNAVVRVRRAFEILGEDVPENLRDAGEARIAHPSDSLAALAERLDPPASKDAVAGRLRRLMTLADREAERRGVPTTKETLENSQRDGER